MPKTRRTKQNRSPGRAYRNAKAYVAVKGDMVTTTGLRGKTVVKRVTDNTGKRLTTIRVTEPVKQPPVPKTGNPTAIFVGRQYTGVARSKPYPYRSVKRGAAPVAPEPKGIMGGFRKAARAIKKVVVQDVA